MFNFKTVIMKAKRFKPEQISRILKDYDLGKDLQSIIREYGVGKSTFYKRRQRYGGMESIDLKRLKQLEAGRTRPVLAVQTNLLNKISHPSTIICPITTNVEKYSEILRVHLEKGTANMLEDCDIMIDQIRAIDNKRLIRKIGVLSSGLTEMVRENIKVILEIDSCTKVQHAV